MFITESSSSHFWNTRVAGKLPKTQQWSGKGGHSRRKGLGAEDRFIIGQRVAARVGAPALIH